MGWRQNESKWKARQPPFCLGGTRELMEKHQSCKGPRARGAAWFSPQRHIAGSAASVGYLRPLLRSDVEGVSHQTLLGVLHAPLHKLRIDLLLHEHPGGGRAALTLVEENSLMGALHCQVHWTEGVAGAGGSD